MKPNRKLKKPPHTPPKLVLEEIIGLTAKNANGLASSACDSKCVYVAGCVVVVYEVELGTQSHLVASDRPPRPLSCVAVSRDGKFVAAGESGNQSAVVVWDCATFTSVSDLKGHQDGVACTAFSSDGKHLVSVGFPPDGYLCLWHWRSGILVTKLKACSSCSSVASVSFSADAKFIVTAGKRHLKIWTIGSSTRFCSKSGARSLALQGKTVNLNHQKGCSFTAVTSPLWPDSGRIGCNQIEECLPLYALTDSGILCLLRSGLKITNSVDLKAGPYVAQILTRKTGHGIPQKVRSSTAHYGLRVREAMNENFIHRSKGILLQEVRKGFALSVSKKLVACACNNGVVKLFANDSLRHAGSLHYSDANRCNNANDVECHAKAREDDSQSLRHHPDATACQFSTPEKLVVVYGDHSLYIWDIHDGGKATKSCVLVSHSACIWDIKNLSCENMHDPSLACFARGCSGGVSFATCSADGVIRLWDLALQPVLLEGSSTHATGHSLVVTEPVVTTNIVSAGIFERDSMMSGVSTQGFRAMSVSSDGKYLAAGDCMGNLHIYNLQTSEYTCIQDAHTEEILSLSFSNPVKKDGFSEKHSESHYLLASGGRDQMIHLYDVESNFDLIGSVDDHSAAVTFVKITGNGCKVLSCSANKSLFFHDVAATDTGYKISRCDCHMASQRAVYDMDVDPLMELAVTMGEDKKMSTFNIASGKLIRSFKLSGEFGDPIKVSVDPSSSYLVCTFSDSSFGMYDYMTGEMVARAVGHGDIITGVIFLPDCKHIVSVGSDGCIFVWKAPAPLSLKMMRKIKETSYPFSPSSIGQSVAFTRIKFREEDEFLSKIKSKYEALLKNSKSVGQRMSHGGGPQETSAFKFSISRLPSWAQAKVTSPKVIPIDPELVSSQLFLNDASKFGCKLHLPRNAPLPPVSQTPSKHDLDGSKQFPGIIIQTPDSDSQCSSTTQETHRSSEMDNRWFTIYNVCFDQLNSPEVWNMKDMTLPVTISNLSVETADTKQTELLSGEPIANNSSVAGVEITTNTNAFSAETLDNDVFNLNFTNLSATSKTGGKKSSARKRYSARFFLRRDLLRGQKELVDTPTQDFGGDSMEMGKDSSLKVSLEEQSMKVLEESQSVCEQDVKDSTVKLMSANSNLTGFSVANKAINVEVIDVRDQEECNLEANEKQAAINACKDSLLNLDAATENALLLFSKLGSLDSGGGISRGPEAQLYAEAAEMLPSIGERVHTFAKMVKSMHNNSCG